MDSINCYILKDINNKELQLKVHDGWLSKAALKNINCVSITARYDHGFGFSQLYRFVNDKKSEMIRDFCDIVTLTNKSYLLPIEVSSNWNVIITPIIKGNNDVAKALSKNTMKENIELSQSINTISSNLLITQLVFMMSYKEKQYEGIFEAIRDLQKIGFKSLNVIHFEINEDFSARFNQQLRNVLI